MDNDTLINQARDLYAALYVEQYARSIGNKTRFTRLDHAVTCAYCRYQRRLNRCVLCYQHRLYDCYRDFWGGEAAALPRSKYSPDTEAISKGTN